MVGLISDEVLAKSGERSLIAGKSGRQGGTNFQIGQELHEWPEALPPMA